jgi:hypothetical protein
VEEGNMQHRASKGKEAQENHEGEGAVSRTVALSACLAMLVTGCTGVLGYDDIGFTDEDAGASRDAGTLPDEGSQQPGADALSWVDAQDTRDAETGFEPPVVDGSVDDPDGPSTGCGDGVCSEGETCETCVSDCGACPPVPPTCGNGACEAGETCQSCASDCGACPPTCGNGACEPGETCETCASDCGACPPTVTHEAEFITWNLYNNAGCTSISGSDVAKWYDRDDGPGPLSIRDTLLSQDPAILALQEDGVLGPSGCTIGTVKDKVAGWLAGTHDVRSTDDVSGGASGERYGIFIKKSKYRFINAGYQKCYANGGEVRGFLWAEVDLISDNTSNHFYVLNAHFKAFGTTADIEERKAQAECVIHWVQSTKASHPYRAHFLLGDFNSGPDHQTEAYALLTGPSGPFENTSTAGPNDINTHGDHWIDHVLGTKGDFTKAGYGSWTIGAGQVQNGGALSDHLGLRTRIGHVR